MDKGVKLQKERAMGIARALSVALSLITRPICEH